ncbi:NAD(P)-dependent oxidoreductase [Phaeacidiphilus oryzae]|jgi:putative NADH-flavin reductase|uniref:NAD(P)-dependent oxidoreductase n=1 Tax=Phaeacidiphilus oryzae TaxID=348818 RepID=UPI00056202C1|nr:SDR family oxidoreductase [Phaeacidiphilus oryzae]
MRITVLGATGGIGGAFVQQALDQGHEVTAVVRDPARLTTRHPRLSVRRGDVTDPGSLKEAVAGADAVVSALGPRGLRGDMTVNSRGAHAALTAMRAAGVERIAVVSAGAVQPAGPGEGPATRYLVRPLLWALLGRHYRDLRAMERELRESGTDWTVVRPPRLTNGPHTGRYRTAVDGAALPRARTLSRADVADALLHALGDAATRRRAIAVGY